MASPGVLPYVPPGQGASHRGEVAPAVEPYLPIRHGPEQLAEARPPVLPYRPGGHTEHREEPGSENCPGGQAFTVEFVLPAGQVNPAEHSPLHPALVSPDVDPNVPAGHGPLHDALPSPADDPYSPGAQSTHAADPTVLYRPSGHNAAVGVTDPATHAYPAEHCPLQAAEVIPAVDPYNPAGQGVHDPAPLRLKVPAGHKDVTGLVEPAGHAYPAAQLPEQPGEVAPGAPQDPELQRPEQEEEGRPWFAPTVPAGQSVHTSAP